MLESQQQPHIQPDKVGASLCGQGQLHGAGTDYDNGLRIKTTVSGFFGVMLPSLRAHEWQEFLIFNEIPANFTHN
jgi:hypothetical protein